MTSIERTDRVGAMRRNVLLLAGCQALYMTSTSAIFSAAALVGYTLTDDKALSTLPVALQFVAVMATTMPASLLMRRIGRRDGFLIGCTIGIAGALLATKAIIDANFALYCVGSLLVGAFNGFAQFYRFAAADAATDTYRSRAIALVMAGGVVASVGPLLGSLVKDLFAPVAFAGIYAGAAGLYFLTMVLLVFVTIPRPSAEERAARGRPLRAIVAQPAFFVAVLGALAAYGSMSLVMGAIPLAMAACGFAFLDMAQVLQWHVFGMFAPGFLTGHLIRRYGMLNVMMLGAVIEAICVIADVSGTHIANFWIGGILLGVGWNFLFVSATTLVTECYTPAEKAKTQAANDFLVFACVAVASLGAGVLHEWIGFKAMNFAILPILLLSFGTTLALARTRRRAAALG
jgi:MFS family permease